MNIYVNVGMPYATKGICMRERGQFVGMVCFRCIQPQGPAGGETQQAGGIPWSF